VRWGITNNLTFNGTFNPDFSQVEADVNQVNFDPRRQVFFPERRPFFIDGIEQFQTPNNLVYTRRIVQPRGGGEGGGQDGRDQRRVHDRAGRPHHLGHRGQPRSSTSCASRATSARSRASR
jgi:hypothetical protein